MFCEGQWVKIPNGKIGYIRELIYSNYYKTYKVSVHVASEGKHYVLDLEECEDYEFPNVPKEDLLAITDLALDTKDAEWFKELTT